MSPVSAHTLAVPAPAPSRPRTLLPAAAVALLVAAGLTAFWAASRSYAWPGPAAAEASNLVVAGFRSGHAWMDKAAPPELAAAANPYKFGTYRPFLGPPWNLSDLSYYRGHLYAYFGVTPVVVLFWPYRVLTGGYLHEAHAVLLFGLAGYALSVGLALALWRRYFPAVGSDFGAAAALLLGSATTLPVFLVRPGLYEVSISCGYAFVMLALAALWQAWHRPGARRRWAAAAGLAFGLAVGARPSLLFAAAVVFLPALGLGWARRRDAQAGPWLGTFLAALLPLAAVGAALAWYNALRFDHPLQFGHDYQLSGNDVYGTRSFDPRFAWDNIRLYFLAPVRWHLGFPFIWEPVIPALTPGHLPIEFFFGTLMNMPILLLALAAPLAWRAAGGVPGPTAVRGLLLGLALLFVATVVPICCYAGATSRYFLDFLPALALLAVLGWLAAEARLDPVRGTLWVVLGYSAAICWILALALSLFFQGGEAGVRLLQSGRVDEGIAVYQRLGVINPDFRPKAELAIGATLLGQDRPADAVPHLQAALRARPTLATADFDLGSAFIQLGRWTEAAAAFREATRLDPADAEAEGSLATALARMGRLNEAADHLRAAIRIDPSRAGYRQALESLEKSMVPARP